MRSKSRRQTLAMDYWTKKLEDHRSRADELRAMADATKSREARTLLLKIAQDYDALAQLAARELEAEMHRRNQEIDKQAG